MSENSNEAVVAVFGQDALNKAAADIKSAVSSYGKVSGFIRSALSRMLVNGRKAEDVSPDDRAEFIKAACELSGSDYKALSQSGLLVRVARELGFKVESKNGKGSGIVKINVSKSDNDGIVKAIKDILKIAKKNKDIDIKSLNSAIAALVK